MTSTEVHGMLGLILLVASGNFDPRKKIVSLAAWLSAFRAEIVSLFLRLCPAPTMASDYSLAQSLAIAVGMIARSYAKAKAAFAELIYRRGA